MLDDRGWGGPVPVPAWSLRALRARVSGGNRCGRLVEVSFRWLSGGVSAAAASRAGLLEQLAKASGTSEWLAGAMPVARARGGRFLLRTCELGAVESGVT